MAASNKPNTDLVHLFYSHQRGSREGWATRMIKGMEVDTPVLVSEHAPSGVKLESARTAISAASRRLEVKVGTRMVGDQLYAMRLREDDPAQAPVS